MPCSLRAPPTPHLLRLELDLSIPPPITRYMTPRTSQRAAQQRAYRWGPTHSAPGLVASVGSLIEDAGRLGVEAIMVLAF
ncbi:hypothetical protein DL93DRAFT_2092334 [Clavulina sp. PMI_390]|nr:hypothetical protein DL93DRAFT_2092334 [Clavulina sp. PMI_390]